MPELSRDWLEVATIAFTEFDFDAARSAGRPSPRQLIHVAAQISCCTFAATGPGKPGANTIEGSLWRTGNGDHLSASLTAPRTREHPRQQGRQNRPPTAGKLGSNVIKSASQRGPADRGFRIEVFGPGFGAEQLRPSS